MAKTKTNLQTLNAKAQLYGNKVTPTTVFRTMFSYELIILAYAVLLFGRKNIIMIALMAIIGAVFVYKGILPYKVDDYYREQSENERNQFMQLVTQEMSSPDASIVYVMQRATDAASGEFYDDMMHLMIKIRQTSNVDVVHPAFQAIREKYKEDTFFCMMMDECETTYFEAQYNADTFRSFLDAHTFMIDRERYYEKAKKDWQSNLMMLLVFCFFVECAVMMMGGYTQYQQLWLNIGGFSVSVFFFIVIAKIIRTFYRRFYDNDVMHQ